ncbi:putative response regulator receiver modulated diguanylate cyclase (CheY-like superfamily 1-136) [Magnetospirillum sp. XM-1]|uniref:response regulator n=1 Tax=Magnetospirillum sp. XM-1 TaxID=1663591 RepID=UPI00073DCABE|nr:response regulator [Magnetospirillum sp. XM-1]CUW38658.1 putative response regulator receiver modulated diguanylate cyclase (CheY-like superfamily 1-136) [Magnetospirillum sp. XM-1]
MVRILAVDDDPVSMLVLTDTLADAGYMVDQAVDGEQAWEMLAGQPYDLVLLDRMMPRLDGLSLLKRMKATPSLARTPVIMETAATAQDDIRQGLEAGAHYYLSKPFSPDVLRLLVASVVSDRAESNSLRQAGDALTATVRLMTGGEFTFRTPQEAQSLAAGLAQLCDNPDDAGLGLFELMMNAVEHGNLGISYDEKTALRRSWRWEQEIESRLAASPWSERVARIGINHLGEDVEFTIVDQGAGFDWQQYLQFDPKRAFDVHGRGIALANTLSFSQLEYRGNGNEVVARTRAHGRVSVE